VRSWLQSGFRPVLCSADSNIAVDNLVDGCAKASLNVVRIGRPEATRADLEQYNLLQMASGIGPGGFDPQLQYSQMKGVLAGADVVCATCAGSDHPVLEKMSFARVLLDEAGQATELSTLVPLMKMKAESAVALWETTGSSHRLSAISKLTLKVLAHRSLSVSQFKESSHTC